MQDQIYVLPNRWGRNFFRWLELRFYAQEVIVGDKIQKAIDKLPLTGGTVLLGEGTYTAPVRIVDNVTIIGKTRGKEGEFLKSPYPLILP